MKFRGGLKEAHVFMQVSYSTTMLKEGERWSTWCFPPRTLQKGFLEGKVMLALAHHKKRHVMAITSRSVLAVVFAITALANIITVMKEFPWNSMVVTEPLIDLGGPAWEQDGLIITEGLLLLI